MKNEELILRIEDSDFSEFAGYYYTTPDYEENNEALNAYIKFNNIQHTYKNIR